MSVSFLLPSGRKLDIVKEDLCGHVMPHVEGRVPLVWPGLLGLTLERRLQVGVMAPGRCFRILGTRILGVSGPCESALV